MSDFTAPGVTPQTRDELLAADPELGAMPVDDDLESDLDAIERELTADAALTTLVPMELRPGWAVRCRIDFDGKALDGLRKQAKDRKFADGVDGTKFAALLVASQAEAIVRQGKDLTLPDVDGPVTFLTRELQERIGVGTAREAVLKLFAAPGQVDKAGRILLAEAGYSEEGESLEDPTT